MLIQLHISNFQRHEKLSIDFGRITVLSGPTDSGKSSILRALRWLCLNDLAGDDFIREGAKQCTVELAIRRDKRDYTIKRIRSPSLNSYELDGKEFKAFGTSVPSEIANLLQLSEINFQSQHDAPFWFSESAPEVSRQLNAVIDLSVIDSSLSFVAAKVRAAQDRKKLVEERLASATTELEGLAPQKQRLEDFDQIKGLYETASEAEKHRGRLEGMLTQIRDCRNRYQTAQEKLEGGDVALSLGRVWKDAEGNRLRLRMLADAANGGLIWLEETEENAKEAEAKLKRETKGQRCPLCQNVIS